MYPGATSASQIAGTFGTAQAAAIAPRGGIIGAVYRSAQLKRVTNPNGLTTGTIPALPLRAASAGAAATVPVTSLGSVSGVPAGTLTATLPGATVPRGTTAVVQPVIVQPVFGG